MYLHIDGKSDASLFSRVHGRVREAKVREKVYWGGFSQVAANLSILTTAYSDPENTHFFLMSGQCFPIRCDEEIAELLNRSAGAGSFMTLKPMPLLDKPLWRLRRFHFYDIGRPRLARGLNALAKFLPRRNLKHLLRGMEPCGGSSWWLLNREAAQRLLEFIAQNPWYSQAFSHANVPDELFFQTLVRHLGISLAGDSPTATRWSGKPHPETIDSRLLAEMRQGWHLAARKFDSVRMMDECDAAQKAVRTS